MFRRLILWIRERTKLTLSSPNYLGTIKATPSELPRLLGMPIVYSNYIPPGQVHLVPFVSLRLEDAITASDLRSMPFEAGYIVAHVGLKAELERITDEDLLILRKTLAKEQEEILRRYMLEAVQVRRSST